MLAALVAPDQLSKFIQDRRVPRSTPGIFDTAMQDIETRGTVTRANIIALRDAWAVYAHERNLREVDWLAGAVKSETAMAELLELLNLIFVPTLARLRLVTSTPAARP